MMVKICGITNREDALAAAEGGVTALGFNFCSMSPRYVQPETAAEIIQILPPAIWKVGVFVNAPPDRIANITKLLNLDVVQLHGDETEFPIDVRVWKAARVTETFDISEVERCPAEAVLLDSASNGIYGGSGKSFDWSLARNCARKVIVAGGLDAANVRQAIEQARPWGVDACSRIESAPGKKNHVQMAAFLKSARSGIA